MRWWLAAAAFFLALEGIAGCAGAPPRTDAGDGTVCAEYRELRCATPRECSMDRERGCLVCRCGAPPVATWPNGQLPSGVAPDRRQPQ
jgi:hypothetical protein